MIGVLLQLLALFIVLAVAYYVVKIGAGHFGVPGAIVQLVGLILGLRGKPAIPDGAGG